MRAGTLRDEIALQEKVVTRDAVGGEVVTWSDVRRVRANAQPISGREYVALRAAQSDISIRFRTRWVPGVSTAMRVLWNGAGYDILEAINVGARNVELELLCRGVAGDA